MVTWRLQSESIPLARYTGSESRRHWARSGGQHAGIYSSSVRILTMRGKRLQARTDGFSLLHCIGPQLICSISKLQQAQGPGRLSSATPPISALELRVAELMFGLFTFRFDPCDMLFVALNSNKAFLLRSCKGDDRPVLLANTCRGCER